ncbi:hypothetical protein [Flavobacterium sp. AG291]|uniref:hypothetical protein n=1 Tax=Flavobacterium sp. AG291 TaxID=2184000 RepID=UPI000E0C2873|nr:hypothetical protein [Flavobacterium sp. AG291]RDI15799.1 hypothetical protein DEU42_10189 [Flavobacterium sp. AG291]
MSVFGKTTQSVVVGGLFLLIPLVILIIVAKHALGLLAPLGENIGNVFGISTLFGKATVTIICLVILLLFCYLAGLMLKLGFVSNWGSKVEEKIYLFMPQLQIMKYKLTGESDFIKSAWTPILLKDDCHYDLVFVTNSMDEPILSIYIAGAPRLDSGEVRYLIKAEAEYHVITMKQAMDAIMSFGKEGGIHEELKNLIPK